jgi:hypothetical protein
LFFSQLEQQFRSRTLMSMRHWHAGVTRTSVAG